MTSREGEHARVRAILAERKRKAAMGGIVAVASKRRVSRNRLKNIKKIKKIISPQNKNA